MERLKNPKLIAALVLVVLAGIVFYQNSNEVTLRVLFFGSLTTRIATALAFAFLTGMGAGALAFSRWKSKREHGKNGSGDT
ncbi:MAG TPA: LapA family protein [Planctomycetota bacterium]